MILRPPAWGVMLEVGAGGSRTDVIAGFSYRVGSQAQASVPQLSRFSVWAGPRGPHPSYHRLSVFQEIQELSARCRSGLRVV